MYSFWREKRGSKGPRLPARVAWALSCAPVVEETSSGGVASLQTISAFGPDGLRSRYTVTGGGSETAFFYDPQGTLVSRIVSGDVSVKSESEVFTDLCVWDGYGQQRSDQWAGQTVDVQYTPSDPVGFEGQAGYYQDWELSQTSNPQSYVYLRSVPTLLTRRYYDASTGRFVSRDPIGYGGGANLYAYCGGNPVNRKDPNGTQSPIGDGTYEDPWEYLSNGFDHSTPHDWWIAARYNSVTKAVLTLGDIVSWIPGDPAFDAKVAIKGGAEVVEHASIIARVAQAGYKGSGVASNLISIKRVLMALGRSGLSVKDYDIVLATADETVTKGPGVFGWIDRTISGKVIRNAQGQPIIKLTPLALTSMEEAVKTIGHEIGHIRDSEAGIVNLREEPAVAADLEFYERFLKGSK